MLHLCRAPVMDNCSLAYRIDDVEHQGDQSGQHQYAEHHVSLKGVTKGSNFLTNHSQIVCIKLCYALSFFSTPLSSTALVATVIELALIASAPHSGASRIPMGYSTPAATGMAITL